MLQYKRWIGGVLLFPLILTFTNVEIARAQSSTNYEIDNAMIQPFHSLEIICIYSA